MSRLALVSLALLIGAAAVLLKPAWRAESFQPGAPHATRLRFGTVQAPPLAVREQDGKLEGYLGLYLEALERQFDFRADIRFYASVTELIDALDRGDIDVVGPVERHMEVSPKVSLTAPLERLPIVLVADPQARPGHAGLQQLDGARVGVTPDAVVGAYRAKAPQASFVGFEGGLDALHALQSGAVEYVILDLAQARFLLHELGGTQLGIVGQLPFVYEPALAFRTRDLTLSASLTQAMQEISPAQVARIRETWLREDPGTDADSTRIALTLGGGAAVVVMSLAVPHLRRRLTPRRCAESVSKREPPGRSGDSASADAFVRCDRWGLVRFASRDFLSATGYCPDEPIGQPVATLVHEDDGPRLSAGIRARAARANIEPIRCRIRRKDGAYRDASAVLVEDVAASGAVRIQFSDARSVPVDTHQGGDSRFAAATDVQLLVEAGSAEAEAPRSVLPMQATFDAYRRALARGEFTLHYQARVRLASGEVTGYEALIRRTDSESSSSPADLIEMAERSGFGAQLGEWVLRSAASQSAAWRRCGLTVPIAVNLSSSQLWGDGLVGLLDELIAQDPTLGAHLELELAEPLFALHIEDTTRLLKELSRMGLSVQVDRFGVGGAHLHRLGQMPVRALKIDRALVNAAQGSVEARRLVRAAIALSRAMELNAIAVGVETAAQYNFLKSWGCPEAQGFLIARPSPAGEVARTWTARRCT